MFVVFHQLLSNNFGVSAIKISEKSPIPSVSSWWFFTKPISKICNSQNGTKSYFPYFRGEQELFTQVWMNWVSLSSYLYWLSAFYHLFTMSRLGPPCAGGTFFNACLVHAGGIPNDIAPSLPFTTLVMTILSTSDVGWIREGKKCVAYSAGRDVNLGLFFCCVFLGGCFVGFGFFR